MIILDHTHLFRQQKLQELGWEVLFHPPYSMNPTDCHCFVLYKIPSMDRTLIPKRLLNDPCISFWQKKRIFMNTGL